MTMNDIKEVLEQKLNGVTPWSIACQLNYKENKRIFTALELNQNSTTYERAEAIKRRFFDGMETRTMYLWQTL
jgi:hypothetical protein